MTLRLPPSIDSIVLDDVAREIAHYISEHGRAPSAIHVHAKSRFRCASNRTYAFGRSVLTTTALEEDANGLMPVDARGPWAILTVLGLRVEIDNAVPIGQMRLMRGVL